VKAKMKVPTKVLSRKQTLQQAHSRKAIGNLVVSVLFCFLYVFLEFSIIEGTLNSLFISSKLGLYIGLYMSAIGAIGFFIGFLLYLLRTIFTR